MVSSIRVLLRGYGDAPAGKREFFTLLGIGPSSPLVTQAPRSAHTAATVELFTVSAAELAGAAEPSELFAARVAEGFAAAAKLLREVPADAFDKWRAGGHRCDVFIDGWIESDQLDLSLPAEFLLACGQAGLPIEICTND